jgi:Tol biopolymer transport system component
MGDLKSVLERGLRGFEPSDDAFERTLRRRDRKRRNQRIAAGVVGIAVFVAAVWIVTSVGSLDRSQTAVIPGDDVTEPAETGPVETGPTVTEPRQAIGPVPQTDYLLDLKTGETTPLPESIVGEKYPGTQGIFGATEYAASPDGSRLAYSAPGDNGESQIFVANLDGTGIEQVTHDLEAAFSPVWSPDGSKIAYVRQPRDEPHQLNIFVVDLATGTSTQLTFTSLEPGDSAAPEFGPRAYLPSFTPDGSSVVYGAYRWETGSQHGEYEVRTVPVAGGESERLMGWQFRDDMHLFGNARLSPDGSLLSYSCEGGLALCITNTDGTDERELSRLGPINAGSWSPDGTRIPYFEFNPQDVFILDVATGQATYVAEGMWPTWLDDHTLIVEIARCYDPEIGRLNLELGCGG